MKPFFPNETERRGARARLRELIREHSLEFGSFALASGRESHFYLDLRRTTTHPEGAYLVATLLLDRLQQHWPDAAGGPTLGADPIAGALAALSHLHGTPLRTFIVRSSVKDHGTGRIVEGHLRAGDRVVLFDDVITQGGSLIRAARLVREAGAQADRAVVILDRQSGAAEHMAREGVDLEALFTLGEILTPQEIAAPPNASPAPGTGSPAARPGERRQPDKEAV
ncbi:MAG: orotate phosphoribosyltransferase [Candidatus Eisenbacteria sp.]|nr:orotate phosphoribosyltransferase [Candidatus Eisenbacteria bacterium]